MVKKSLGYYALKDLEKMAKKPPKQNSQEEAMVRNLDVLAEFQEFQDSVLPAIRQDLASGKSAEEILEKYAAYAAARQATIAVADPDSGRALAAIKDILDRTKGRATEKKEISHKFDNLKDKELDSLLETLIDDDAESTTSTKQ